MKTGTILLPTLSACSIFEHELQGQFSDGMWENSRPHDHWKFWCNLRVKLDPGGAPRVEREKHSHPKKTSYNIAALYSIIGDRMLKIGRMARAAASLGFTVAPWYSRAAACEHMPPTLSEWRQINDGHDDRLACFADQMREVPPALVEAYYATSYTMKDLRSDVALIKRAMKSLSQ